MGCLSFFGGGYRRRVERTRWCGGVGVGFLILAGLGEARSQQPLAATMHPQFPQAATNESPARKQALAATRWIWNLRPTAVPSYLDVIVLEEQRDWVGVRFSWWDGRSQCSSGCDGSLDWLPEARGSMRDQQRATAFICEFRLYIGQHLHARYCTAVVDRGLWTWTQGKAKAKTTYGYSETAAWEPFYAARVWV